MFQQFDIDVIIKSFPYLMKGMGYTIRLTLVAMTGGIFLGTLLAMARLSKIKFLSLFSSVYVNLLRTIPLILVIFWMYFLIPLVIQWIKKSTIPVPIGANMSAYITFTVFLAAFYCEIIRAGIQSISRGQIWAGYALGLNYWQVMKSIVLPQAFRNMLPVLLTQTIVLFQDTSLVYVLGATDFLGAASKVAQRDSRLVEMYLFVAATYFIICYVMSKMVSRLHRKTTL